MKQETLNAMMRYPWESKSKPQPMVWQQCPRCNENYAGDGVTLCIECQHDKQEKQP